MVEKPLVSFVLPTHNRIEWIAEAVTGILAQTEKAIELVIVDDGSTDGTEEFLRDWLKDNPRVVIHKNARPLGGGPSRHLGAELAKADIICVMDDDDFVTDDRAELTLKWFKDHPDSELVTFPYVSVGYNNEIIQRYDGEEFDHDDFKKTGRVNYYCNPSVAMRKASYFETKGYMKETDKQTDDIQFLHNWIEAGKKIDFCPGNYVLGHRVLPSSMMAKMRGFKPEWVTK